MSEKEEKLINKIKKLQILHNSLKLDDEIEKYKKEIKEAESDIDKTKDDINNLLSELKKLENNNENNNDSPYEKEIENKTNTLNNLIGENNMLQKQLNEMKTQSDNYKNKNFILEKIKNWDHQVMFKYIQLYDKKPEK